MSTDYKHLEADELGLFATMRYGRFLRDLKGLQEPDSGTVYKLLQKHLLNELNEIWKVKGRGWCIWYSGEPKQVAAIALDEKLGDFLWDDGRFMCVIGPVEGKVADCVFVSKSGNLGYGILGFSTKVNAEKLRILS